MFTFIAPQSIGITILLHIYKDPRTKVSALSMSVHTVSYAGLYQDNATVQGSIRQS
jgi:hypothetical protein